MKTLLAFVGLVVVLIFLFAFMSNKKQADDHKGAIAQINPEGHALGSLSSILNKPHTPPAQPEASLTPQL